MHRNTFAPPPAHSPPLHHPVPQHVSHVPMMRSPPPPASQPQQPQSSSYGNPYQPVPAPGGSGTFNPGFGGFMTDPTAQMGFQVGQHAVKAGTEYMEQNVLFPLFLKTKPCPTPCRPLPLVLPSLLTILVKPLRVHPSFKTLLRCLQYLRPPQTRHRPLSLATQTMVTSTSPSLLDRRLSKRPNHPTATVHLLFPRTSRGSQLSRPLHSRHGGRNIHHFVYPTRRLSRFLPPRTPRLNNDHSLRCRGFRNRLPQAGHVSPEH